MSLPELFEKAQSLNISRFNLVNMILRSVEAKKEEHGSNWISLVLGMCVREIVAWPVPGQRSFLPFSLGFLWNKIYYPAIFFLRFQVSVHFFARWREFPRNCILRGFPEISLAELQWHQSSSTGEISQLSSVVSAGPTCWEMICGIDGRSYGGEYCESPSFYALFFCLPLFLSLLTIIRIFTRGVKNARRESL